ncbi:hypothetical protein ZIOFF_040899 [Zingiber officinale]|uniref:Transmembrane 9 superfamily member n=1 Tax=Zingiber officinale TaxID=94328 RepID=A0A8J5G4T3_ZINOF|nr:hypothetical protein ZIOFF_040899 [Zingiber officinale]
MQCPEQSRENQEFQDVRQISVKKCDPTTVAMKVNESQPIAFTYEVTFIESDIKWHSCWDAYLKMEGAKNCKKGPYPILGMAVVTIFFAALGFMSPASRGALVTGMLFFYLILEIAAGHSTGAIPISLFVVLLLLWFCISLPLTLTGGFLGAKASHIEFPVRTNQIPREIPQQKYPSWLLVIGAGTLPFGSVAIYIFLYSINYLIFDLKSLSGPVSATLYLGYSLFMVTAIMLATGTVGFISSFCFVHYLFSSVKLDWSTPKSKTCQLKTRRYWHYLIK